jgi:hypothetical protein
MLVTSPELIPDPQVTEEEQWGDKGERGRSLSLGALRTPVAQNYRISNLAHTYYSLIDRSAVIIWTHGLNVLGLTGLCKLYLSPVLANAREGLDTVVTGLRTPTPILDVALTELDN